MSPPLQAKGLTPRKLRRHRTPANLELACDNDKDPLCGALDK